MNGDDERDNDGADEQEHDEEEPTSPPPRHGSHPFEGTFRVPPEVGRGLQRVFETLRYSRPAGQALEAVQQFARLRTPGLDAMVEQVRRQVAVPLLQSPQWQQAMARLRASLGRSWPDNWDDLSAHDIGAVMTIAQDEGVPLVWVPRGELVAQMLAAPDAAARRALLEAHVDEIVADCAAVVAAVDHPRLREHQDRLAQAVAAHQAGLHAAGQALAAVVVTALLQWVYGHRELKKVRTSPMRVKDEDDQLLRDLKVAVLIEAAVPATAGGMDQLSDDQLPDRFNRHATLHRVADRAYTLPNAMSALMLATGLLAEAQQLLEDGRLTSSQ